MSESRKAELRREMISAREITLWLLQQVSDEFLRVRVHDFYSPIGWHFGHIGRTEEYWTVGQVLGKPLLDDELSFLFADLPENPKDNRVNIPDRAGILDYLRRTRARAVEALEMSDLSSDDPFLADGYAWEFARQHECQHQETIAEMLTLIQKERGYDTLPEPIEWTKESPTDMISIPAGEFTMGSNWHHGYDNEKQAHRVSVSAFELDQFPVTAYEWTRFMEDGGYSRPDLWRDDGWTWREGGNVERPEYWIGDRHIYGAFGARSMDPDEAVSSISWYEADAYARWAGRRLPTEVEWEYAARRDTGSRVFGFNSWKPLPEGGMSGNVWEWTVSKFLPYPDFEAFPYDGYSKDHMEGKHFVCRGGSWATNESLLRPTFRNWYVPTYRQGFLGVRCAR